MDNPSVSEAVRNPVRVGAPVIPRGRLLRTSAWRATEVCLKPFLTGRRMTALPGWKRERG
eukprot:15461716-Alexandrium_andersonii.AAC.1